MPDAEEPATDSAGPPTPTPADPPPSGEQPARPVAQHDDLQRPLDEGRPVEPAPAPAGAADATGATDATGAADVADVTGADLAAGAPGAAGTAGVISADAVGLGDLGAAVHRAETDGGPVGDDLGEAEAEAEAEASAEELGEGTEGSTGEGTGAEAAETTPLRSAVPTTTATTAAATPAAAGSMAVRSHRATVALARVARGGLIRGLHAARLAPGQAARALAGWSRRPTGRLTLSGATIAAMLTAAVTTGALVIPSTGVVSGEPDPGPEPAPTGAPTLGPPGPVPPGTTPDLTLPGNPTDPLRSWAERMSDRTDIPVIAMLAYGYAELVVANTTPACNLSWTTLAAIGQVETHHGSNGGSSLSSDGRALPPIVGDPLDGQGDRLLIQDTDGGQLDGDTEYDRAVGPMQFIPETWALAAVDASGDGVADVHNIHDAALAAANYLCDGGRDLSTPDDWWEAIHSYNNVSIYADTVFATANSYGQRSRGG